MVRRSSFWVGVFVLGIFSLSTWPVMVQAVQPRTTHSAPSVALSMRDVATPPSGKLSSQAKQITFWQAIPHALPIPDLFATPREGPAPLTVVFDNLSTGATDYLWSFGDGGTSTAFEPTYSYDTPGVYTVTLAASNLTATASITFSHYITVYDYLRVAATRPQNAALIDPIAEPAVVTFTKAVDASTIGPPTFAVRGQYLGLYPGVYTTGELSTTFTPDLPFGPGEELLATASRGIHAVDGSSLVPYSWGFRTGVAASGGYFTATPPWSPPGNMDVALGDLDGDGDLDAFFAGFSTASRIWFNDGQGEFIDSGQRLGNKNSRGVALGDLDGDGDLDAFEANDDVYGRPGHGVWLNNGQGTMLSNGQSLGTGDGMDVALGDLDGDGDLDAFVAMGHLVNQPDRVWWNDGTGHFGDSGQLLGNVRSIRIALGDLDGDGDLDAFTAGYTVGTPGIGNRVWLNDGTGLFVDSGQRPGNTASQSIALGDVDGDGDLDALVGNIDWPLPIKEHEIWLNDGQGIFTDTGQSLGTSSGFGGILLADLDGDTDLDVFTGNQSFQQYRRQKAVWLNDGSGYYTLSQNLGTSSCLGVASGDVDGDGDLDVVEADFDDDMGVTWLNGDAPLVGLAAVNDSPTTLGTPTALTATVAAGTSPTYTWAFGDGQVGSGPALAHVYPAPGLYTAVVTAANHVSALTATTVVLVEEAVAGLAAFNDSPTALGTPTTLTATVSAGTSPTYTWAFGDGEVGSGPALAHVYPAPGLYTAVVTAANHVSALTATTVVLVKETVADLALNQTDSDDPVLAGATLIYRLAATNLGPSEATQVTIVDWLPEGVEFVAAAPTCIAAARTVTCTIGDLMAGTTATVSITVAVPVLTDASLVNVAAVTGNEPDSAPGNNTAQETTAVVDRLCVYTHDFETPVGSEWSNPGTTQSPSGHRFLGEFGNETVSLTLTGLPAHTFATVALDLYVIRSWDGSETAVPQGDVRVAPADIDDVGPDLWEAAISRGARLLYTTFSNWDLYGFRQAYPGTYPNGDYPARTGARENQSLGYQFETIPMDAIYGLVLHFAHIDDVLDLTFSGAGLQPLSDESWGLDNIEVCFSVQTVSQYSVYLPLLSRQGQGRGSGQGVLANPY